MCRLGGAPVGAERPDPASSGPGPSTQFTSPVDQQAAGLGAFSAAGRGPIPTGREADPVTSLSELHRQRDDRD